MHLGSGTYLNDVKNFVDAMNKNDYDLVCFGGDLFDAVSYTHLDVYKRQYFSCAFV